jgi:hypothetical protein
VTRLGASQDGHARRALRQLQKLRLYRAVLTSKQSAAALMPEYVAARGLAGDVRRTAD